jgi:hypothetical protein
MLTEIRCKQPGRSRIVSLLLDSYEVHLSQLLCLRACEFFQGEREGLIRLTSRLMHANLTRPIRGYISLGWMEVDLYDSISRGRVDQLWM